MARKSGCLLDLRTRGQKLGSTAVHSLGAPLVRLLKAAFDSGRHSLRGRLVFTVAGLFLVLMLVEVREYHVRSDDRHAVRTEVLRTAALDAAGNTSLAIRQLIRSQRQLAQLILMGRIAEDQIPAFLQDVLAGDDTIASIEILQPDGQLRYSSTGAGFETDRSKDPLFLALSPQRPNQITNLMVPGNGTPSLIRTGALLTDGDDRRLGVIVTSFYADALARSLLAAGDDRVEGLFDSQGGVVALAPPALEPELLRYLGSRARVQMGSTPVAVDFTVKGNVRYTGFVVPVPDLPWKVVRLQSDRGGAAALAREMQSSLMLMLVVVVVLGLVLVTVLQVSLRPLVRLSAAARKLGSGDLHFRIPAAEIREFETLVDAFNRMTERLERAVSQLEETNQNLEAQVQERTRELEAEHEKLLRAERLSTLGLLSSAIAHDLRNPLNTISLNNDWLRISLGEQANPRVQQRLDTIHREVRRSDRIIRTLLAFARTGEPEPNPTDVNDLVREVAALAEPPENVEVRLELQPDLAWVSLDRAQVIQVLDNLLRNAIQALVEGGQVCVATRGVDGICRITVRDTGPGIPVELQARIFEPLVSTKSTGTGLGLALCKRIVEAHGGEIRLESQPGQGTAFTIDLPLATDAPSPPSETPDAAVQAPDPREREPV